jgi:hypothetical protein
MDIAAMARAAGLTVLLDGRIGRQEYQSVSGSMEALRRFGDAWCAALIADAAQCIDRIEVAKE